MRRIVLLHGGRCAGIVPRAEATRGLCRRGLGNQARQVEHEAVERHGLCEQEALAELDAEGADTLALVLRLDAFGENLKVQRLRQFHDGRNDGAGLGAVERFNEGFIDLDFVEWKFRQIGERRIADAKVIERDRYAYVL